jgi:hypothetical protein
MPKNLTLVVTLHTCIQEVSGLNLSWDTISLSLQENVRLVPQIRP